MSTPNSDGDEPDPADQTDEAVDLSGFGEESNGSDAQDDGADGETSRSKRADRDEGSAELEAQLTALRTENADLSADYARARKAAHRKTALALAAIGVIAVLGGVALPDVRAILLITGSIGLFGGVLTWYLTPERVVPIDVSESVYDATAATLTGIRDELGLQSMTVYVPVDDRVRGFIPRHRAFEPPENAAHVFVTDDGASRGVSFAPTGQRLTSESARIRTTQAPDDAIGAVEQLGDTLVQHFEIADGVTVDEDAEPSRLVVSVHNAAFGPVTRVDHPVVSTLACGVVRAVDGPVAVEPVDDATVVLQTDPGFGNEEP